MKDTRKIWSNEWNTVNKGMSILWSENGKVFWLLLEPVSMQDKNVIVKEQGLFV